MNKDECISKFAASLIIAFPFMAMFAFLVELFTIETFIEISKNHGSLIAGLIGFIGIFILISNQNKTTRDMIENQNQTTKETIASNMQVMRSEALELEKSKIIEHTSMIGCKFQLMLNTRPNEFQFWINSAPNFGSNFFDDIHFSSYLLDAFIQKKQNNLELIICKECIDEFIKLYESPIFYGTLNARYIRTHFNLLFASLINLYNLNGIAKNNSQNTTYMTMSNMFLNNPLDVYDNFHSLSNDDICGFLILHMTYAVMPALLSNIYSVRLEE